MKKKTPKTTTKPSPTSKDAPALTAALKDLPIIRKSINRPKEDKCDAISTIHIVSEEEEMHVKMKLEMDDKTHDMLVKIGKEVASDEDYVEIAVRAGLKHYIHRADASDK